MLLLKECCRIELRGEEGALVVMMSTAAVAIVVSVRMAVVMMVLATAIAMMMVMSIAMAMVFVAATMVVVVVAIAFIIFVFFVIIHPVGHRMVADKLSHPVHIVRVAIFSFVLCGVDINFEQFGGLTLEDASFVHLERIELHLFGHCGQ